MRCGLSKKWFDANLKPKLTYNEVFAILKEMAETMAGLKDYTTDMLMGAAEFGDIKGKNAQVFLKEFNVIQPTYYPFRGWTDCYSYDFDTFNKKEDTYNHRKFIEVCEKFKNIGGIELFVTEADIGSFNDFELQKQRYKELIIASRQESHNFTFGELPTIKIPTGGERISL